MKKTLALILAFAMVFSTITVAFAEEEVGPEAAALAKIEVLKGVDGVTVDYLKEAPTRLQAAIMLLRLKGLEDVAKEFVSEDNFEDVKDYAWAEGKNIMAYLKANPGVGYRGTDKGFEPNKAITPKEFYKVLLVTLGYVENTADVAGDFAWETVEDKIKEVGLGKVLDVEAFTNNDMAIATVEALKLNVKGSEKTLLATLIDNDKVNKDAAVAAGLIEEAPVVTAALKSAKAIGNTVVEVTFDAEINEGAKDVSLYTIEGLEVKDAIVASEKVVRLETSAQTAGKTYTLVVGEVKFNFGGKAKVTGAPELKKVTGTDTETVELEFNKALDFVTATDVANYAIAGVTVEKAELDADTVTLTTNGLAANKTHTIKVTNVKSVDGVALKSASKSFYAKADKTAPKVDTAKALTFKRVLVKFNEELDKESAENVENYTIANLTVEKAELVVDDSADELEKWVELTTSAQKSGTTYSLKVKGVKDASVLANEMTREQTIKFTGKSEDKAGPTLNITKTQVLSRNKIYVQFEDASRLDFATVQNPDNYEFDKDVTVEKVEMTPGYDNDTKTALLTVSDLAEKTYYKLTVTGVADEYGNEIKKTTKTVNYTNSQLEAAKIEKVVTRSATEVRIYFTKYIDAITAKDVANYTINGDIGTPISAKANSGLEYVTLKVNELVEGKEYKVTVKGLQDLAGNVLNTNSKFYGLTTKNDITGPEILDITVVNKNVLRITFDEEIKIVPSMSVAIEKANGTALGSLPLNAIYDDNTVLEFTNGSGFEEIEYRVKSFANVRDLSGNKTVLDVNSFNVSDVNFWGNTLAQENVDFSWEQVNVEKYKLTFSEKVKVKAGTYEDDDADDLGMDTVWYFRNKVAVDKTAWVGDINTRFAQGHGATINNTNDEKDGETKITASIVDEEVPYIENVEAVYRDEVKVTFNEELKKSGSYEITYYDLDGKLKKAALASTAINGDDASIVNIKLSTRLESRFDYTLKVTSVAADLAGNNSEKDEEYGFMGTDLARPENYITGVTFTNGTVATVALQSAVSDPIVVTLKDENNINPLFSFVASATKNKVTITLKDTAFREDVDYTVTVNGMSYTFEGIVTDDITVVKDGNDYTISYDGIKTGDKVSINGLTPVPVPADAESITINFAGTLKTVVVVRDSVIIYYYVEDGQVDSRIDTRENVTTPTELQEAIDNPRIREIVIAGVITGNIDVDRLVNITIAAGKTLTGDITVTSKEAGKAGIYGGGTVAGDLTVNTPNADFVVEAGVTVSGTTTIKDVKSNTFYNYGKLADVVIEAPKAISLVNTGTIVGIDILAAGGKITIDSTTDVDVTNSTGESIKLALNGGAEETVADGGNSSTGISPDVSKVEAVYDVVYARFNADPLDIAEAVAAGFAEAKDQEVEIAFESDNNAVLTIDATGKATITQPEEEDADVTLTVTIQKGIVKMVEDFFFTILKK